MSLFKKEAEVKQPVVEEKKEVKTHNGTVIAQGVTFEGDFTADEQITINGVVKGNIKSSVDTRVGKTGTHIGKMDVKSLHVDGNTESEIVCSELASLGATANYKGTLFTPNIEAAHGSAFDGSLHLQKAAKAGEDEVAVKDFSDLD